MFTPRALYALGVYGLFSSKAIVVNEGGTPVVALAVTVVMATILISLGTCEKLMAIYAFYAVANNIVLISALFVLRKRSPDLPRPFGACAYPFAPVAVHLDSSKLVVRFRVRGSRDGSHDLAMRDGT